MSIDNNSFPFPKYTTIIIEIRTKWLTVIYSCPSPQIAIIWPPKMASAGVKFHEGHH